MLTKLLFTVIGTAVFIGVGGMGIIFAMTGELPSMKKWRNAKA